VLPFVTGNLIRDCATINLRTLKYQFGQLEQQMTPLLNPPQNNNFIKKAHPQNFIAYPHCTHLPLLADTKAHPKQNQKSAISQRFFPTFVEIYSIL
jgi:hypothetical protein